MLPLLYWLIWTGHISLLHILANIHSRSTAVLYLEQWRNCLPQLVYRKIPWSVRHDSASTCHPCSTSSTRPFQTNRIRLEMKMWRYCDALLRIIWHVCLSCQNNGRVLVVKVTATLPVRDVAAIPASSACGIDLHSAKPNITHTHTNTRTQKQAHIWKLSDRCSCFEQSSQECLTFQNSHANSRPNMLCYDICIAQEAAFQHGTEFASVFHWRRGIWLWMDLFWLHCTWLLISIKCKSVG